MVDQHKNLCQRGIVQLFSQTHPPKRLASPWWSKKAPRLLQTNTMLQTQQRLRAQELTKSAQCTRSSENLHTSAEAAKDDGATAAFYASINFIELPKDYNPCAQLQSLEALQTFCARIFPHQQAATNAHEKISRNDLMFDDDSEEHSYTNQLFATSSPTEGVATHTRSRNLLAPCTQTLQQRTLDVALTEKRTRELHVLGCLIVELFAMQRLRPLLMNSLAASFSERLQTCRTLVQLHRHDIPKCLRRIVGVLLQAPTHQELDGHGLPTPPSAAQLLEPIFANMLIPFGEQYYASYALVRGLRSYDHCSVLLELHTHFHCNGQQCVRYSELDRQRVLLERKIAECKVMSCCAHIVSLLQPVAYEQFTSMELLLPHVIELLTMEQTSILAAWNLFDPVAQCLGIASTQRHLLLPISKLYDVESYDRGMISVRGRALDGCIGVGKAQCDNIDGQQRFSTCSSFKSRKSVKLYHHSFLLRLIVRFGLRCFLQNFITPLIEAVGGYKEPEEGSGFHYHSSKLGNQTNRNISQVISTESQSTTVMSEQVENTRTDDENSTKVEIEDVFTFDDDVNSDNISNLGTGENKSIDSFDMRANVAEEAREEDLQVENSTERLAISEIIYGSAQESISNASLEEADKLILHSQSLKELPAPGNSTISPTIEIPTSSLRRSFQLNTIDCDIGSRKSVDSFEIITQAVAEEQKQKQQERAKSEKKHLTTMAPSETAREMEGFDALQASVSSKISEARAAQNNRISEMSAESLMWLSHRLGPVLTSCYITRNLLKMLSLCYVGQENLMPEIGSGRELRADVHGNLNYFSIADARVLGDQNAARVLECLMSIAGKS